MKLHDCFKHTHVPSCPEFFPGYFLWEDDDYKIDHVIPTDIGISGISQDATNTCLPTIC